LLSAVLVIGISLYLSRFSVAPAPATAATDQQKSDTVTAQAVAAADAFLNALDANQRKQAVYDFDSARKSGWSNLPARIVPRNGVRLGDLTKAQRSLAMDAIAAVLSKSGYQKIVDIVDADQRLADEAGGRGAMFGADQYYLAFFGKPSATQPWMLQFGGHHLGLNVSVIGKNFVLTPTHTGAQPAVFKLDGKVVRPLGRENDSAVKLINALDEKQRAQAIIGERPQGEMLLGPGRDGRTIEPRGIKGSALTTDQQAMLLDVIAAWVNMLKPDDASTRMASIKSNISDAYFAWKGPTTKGSAAYFRVQGPTVVIEYAPQGSTDHIHTVIRDPTDDYGTGLLKR
jgi:hypothetical protein